MSMDVKGGFLKDIIAAEKCGTPLSLYYCNKRGGSSWDSIVDCGYVHRCRKRGVTITNSGRKWLEERYPELYLENIPAHNIEIAEIENEIEISTLSSILVLVFWIGILVGGIYWVIKYW